jgi:hypothetical protein
MLSDPQDFLFLRPIIVSRTSLSSVGLKTMLFGTLGKSSFRSFCCKDAANVGPTDEKKSLKELAFPVETSLGKIVFFGPQSSLKHIHLVSPIECFKVVENDRFISIQHHRSHK